MDGDTLEDLSEEDQSVDSGTTFPAAIADWGECAELEQPTQSELVVVVRSDTPQPTQSELVAAARQDTQQPTQSELVAAAIPDTPHVEVVRRRFHEVLAQLGRDGLGPPQYVEVPVEGHEASQEPPQAGPGEPHQALGVSLQPLGASAVQAPTLLPQHRLDVLEAKLKDLDQALIRYGILFEQAIQRIDGQLHQISSQQRQDSRALDDSRRTIQALVSEVGQEKIKELVQNMQQESRQRQQQAFGGGGGAHRRPPLQHSRGSGEGQPNFKGNGEGRHRNRGGRGRRGRQFNDPDVRLYNDSHV